MEIIQFYDPGKETSVISGVFDFSTHPDTVRLDNLNLLGIYGR